MVWMCGFCKFFMVFGFLGLVVVGFYFFFCGFCFRLCSFRVFFCMLMIFLHGVCFLSCSVCGWIIFE